MDFQALVLNRFDSLVAIVGLGFVGKLPSLDISPPSKAREDLRSFAASVPVVRESFPRFAICFVLAVPVCLSGCLSTSQQPPAVAARQDRFPVEPTPTIYLVRHGWHTGIVLEHRDIVPADWPEGAALEGVRYVEVGWGDAGFYQASWMWPWTVANAAFLPSRSALHVSGMKQPLDEYFPESQVVAVDVTQQQVRTLCRFIRDSCARDENHVAEYLGPPRYGSGGFLKGKEMYFVPKTCNTWTARALAAADCPVAVPLCTFSQGVMWQAEKFGRVVRDKSTWLPVLYPLVNFKTPHRYEGAEATNAAWAARLGEAGQGFRRNF